MISLSSSLPRLSDARAEAEAGAGAANRRLPVRQQKSGAYAFGVSQSGAVVAPVPLPGLATWTKRVGRSSTASSASRGRRAPRRVQPPLRPAFGAGGARLWPPPRPLRSRETKDEKRKTNLPPTGSVLRPSSSVTTGGLLDRQRALGSVPKIIATNTAAGSLARRLRAAAHPTSTVRHDVEPSAEVQRLFPARSTVRGRCRRDE